MLIAAPPRQKTAPGNRTTGVPMLVSQHNPVGYFTCEHNWTHISFNMNLRHANSGGQWRRTLAFGHGQWKTPLGNGRFIRIATVAAPVHLPLLVLRSESGTRAMPCIFRARVAGPACSSPPRACSRPRASNSHYTISVLSIAIYRRFLKRPGCR